MVDVGHKAVSSRLATARCRVWLPPNVLDQLRGDDIQTRKGPVFQTAIVAGTMAVKKTAELIPFCHPLPIEKCQLRISLDEKKEVVIDCTVGVTGKTGVEMEALTGATVAALTIYDMCKALSSDIVIRSAQLITKTGGKHDTQRTET